MIYLYLLQQAIIWIITIYWLYQLVVSVCSLIKLKDKGWYAPCEAKQEDITKLKEKYNN